MESLLRQHNRICRGRPCGPVVRRNMKLEKEVRNSAMGVYLSARNGGAPCGEAFDTALATIPEPGALRATLALAEHKIDQYLQGQYPDGASLRRTLEEIRT